GGISPMAKKAAPKAAKPKAASAGAEKKAKSRTKADIYAALADSTGLSKKEVASVFDHLVELIKTALGTRGAGQSVVPGLIKLTARIRPATKAGPKRTPSTKQIEHRPAKPESRVVRARPLKALKEMV